MNRRAYIYVLLVALAACALVAILPRAELYALTARDLFGLAALVALAIMSEAMGIDFSLNARHHARSSIAFLPLLASAILFPPLAATLGVVAVHVVTETALKKRVAWRIAFNVSQGAIAIGLAALLYTALGGSSTFVVHPDFEFPFLAFLALVVVFFSANILVVGSLFALREHTRLRTTVQNIVRSGGGNIIYGLLASPIAIIAAILYHELYIGGLLLITLPLLLIRSSYLAKVQLQEANHDLLRVLIKAIETRDPYTSGHSVRVSQLARSIAEALRLQRRRVEQVETAALLHDIGKIDAAYAPFIRKRSALTVQERAVIRTHAVRGAELLRNLASLDDYIVEGVRHHHERFDGTGYPDGLSGEQIPLPARIICICDAVDAMRSDRPYRSALSVEETRAELVRCSGTQFDPEIVRVMMEDETLEGMLPTQNQDAAPEWVPAAPVS